MTFNAVTINGQFTNGTIAGEGNFCIAAQGSFMDSPEIAIVTPVIIGQLDSNGFLWNSITPGSGVSLLASDNFSVGALTWHFLIRVQGIPDIDVGEVPVNFSNGASQNLFTVLEATGWTAISV